MVGTPKELNENGIFYEKAVNDEVEEYLLENYTQASIVTEGLLEFEHILSRSSFDRLSKESQQKINKDFRSSKIPAQSASSSAKEYEANYRIVEHDKRFDLAESISMKATNIGSAKEVRWSELVKHEIFGKLIISARQAEGIREYEPMQIVDRVRVEDEDLWKHGRTALRKTTPHDATPLSAAKADLYIALPIIKRASNCRGFHRDDPIQNFSEDNLTKLEEIKNGNLISNPIIKLDRVKGIEPKYMVCFPSAVVEIKHHEVKKSKKTQCYCQAANASSTALSMLSRLYLLQDRETNDINLKELRPVVSFTFIGYKTRVWISFVSDCSITDDAISCAYDMKCIWKGDLRDTWDAVQLCRIVENLHYWIVRHFRPWVSSCLDSWRRSLEGNYKIGKNGVANAGSDNKGSETSSENEEEDYDNDDMDGSDDRERSEDDEDDQLEEEEDDDDDEEEEEEEEEEEGEQEEEEDEDNEDNEVEEGEGDENEDCEDSDNDENDDVEEDEESENTNLTKARHRPYAGANNLPYRSRKRA